MNTNNVSVSRELAVAECQTCDWRGTHLESVGEEWGCPVCMKKYGESDEVVWQDYIPVDDYKAALAQPSEQPAKAEQPGDVEDVLDRLCTDVEREYQMSGLSYGLYADYAKDVAKRFAALSPSVPAEAVAVDSAVGRIRHALGMIRQHAQKMDDADERWMEIDGWAAGAREDLEEVERVIAAPPANDEASFWVVHDATNGVQPGCRLVSKEEADEYDPSCVTRLYLRADAAVIALGKECAVSISGFEEDAREVSDAQTALQLIRHCIELGKQAHARANRNDEAVRLLHTLVEELIQGGESPETRKAAIEWYYRDDHRPKQVKGLNHG